MFLGDRTGPRSRRNKSHNPSQYLNEQTYPDVKEDKQTTKDPILRCQKRSCQKPSCWPTYNSKSLLFQHDEDRPVLPPHITGDDSRQTTTRMSTHGRTFSLSHRGRCSLFSPTGSVYFHKDERTCDVTSSASPNRHLNPNP